VKVKLFFYLFFFKKKQLSRADPKSLPPFFFFLRGTQNLFLDQDQTAGRASVVLLGLARFVFRGPSRQNQKKRPGGLGSELEACSIFPFDLIRAFKASPCFYESW
jgi:hypothetical protein